MTLIAKTICIYFRKHAHNDVIVSDYRLSQNLHINSVILIHNNKVYTDI